jgi:excisionase family DNA binding protein
MTSRAVPDPAEVPTVTVDHAAHILGISGMTLRRRIKAGEFPHVRVGNRYLISTARLARMIDPEATA